MLLTFLLVIQAIVAVLLVGVILMQQSEGGGLGMGGSPSGLMSARGAKDFLSRATGVLATIFISLSILHAVLAAQANAPATIDTSLARKPVAPATPATGTEVPIAGQPLMPPATVAPIAKAGPVAVPIASAKPKPVEARQTTRERPAPAPVRVEVKVPPPAVVSTAPAPVTTPAPSNAN